MPLDNNRLGTVDCSFKAVLFLIGIEFQESKNPAVFLQVARNSGILFYRMILSAGNYSASMMALNAVSSSSFFAAASASVAAVVV